MTDSAKKRLVEICAELGEDLDSDSCKLLREYVKSCPDCEAFVDSVKKTIALYKVIQPTLPERTQRLLLKKLNLD